MAAITLVDGRVNRLYDLESGKIVPITLNQHAMRLHVWDNTTNTATEHFETMDRAIQDKVLRALRSISAGEVYSPSTWVHVRNKRTEMWPAGRFAALAERELSEFWGDKVRITGTSLRYIYYVSDGTMRTTPDKIGAYRGAPLIYKGYAVGTIVTIGGYDPLANSANVIYWITRGQWESFFGNYRNKQRKPAGETNFVCSNWCERDPSHTKSEGIYLISMEGDKTLTAWTRTSLVANYKAITGVSLLPKTVEYAPKAAASSVLAKKKFEAIVKDSLKKSGVTPVSEAPCGEIGTRCISCGSKMNHNFGTCDTCGKCNCIQCLSMKYLCAPCGVPSSICGCGGKETIYTKAELQLQASYLKTHGGAF